MQSVQIINVYINVYINVHINVYIHEFIFVDIYVFRRKIGPNPPIRVSRMTHQQPFRTPSQEDKSSGRVPKGRPRKWPFAAMEEGETVSVIDPDLFHSARSCVSYLSKITGRKFKTVTMNNGSLLVRRIS